MEDSERVSKAKKLLEEYRKSRDIKRLDEAIAIMEGRERSSLFKPDWFNLPRKIRKQ